MEKTAWVLMVLSGMVGLYVTLTGRTEHITSAILGGWCSGCFLRDISKPWLVCQSALVLVGSLGLYIRSLTLVAVGILAGLVLVTPVGLLTFVPALLILLLVVPRRRAFWEFMPKWRGEGRPPPGPWR